MSKKKFGRKPRTLAVMLAAAMLCSSFSITVGTTASAWYDDYSNYDVSEHTFSVIGSFTEWNDDIDMTDDDGDGIYEVTINNVLPGTYEFKVRADYSWEESWGQYEEDYDRTLDSQTNMIVTLDEESDITVYFDTTGSDINYWPVTYSVNEKESAYKFAVSGNLGEGSSSYMRNKGNGIYEMTFNGISAGNYQFKINNEKSSGDSWGAYDSNKKKTFGSTKTVDISLNYDTDLTVYFDTSGEKDQWTISYKYIATDGSTVTYNAGDPSKIEDFTFDRLDVYYNGNYCEMTDPDGDGIYTATVKIPEMEYYSYRSFYVVADSDFSKTWSYAYNGKTFGESNDFYFYEYNETDVKISINTNGDKDYWIVEYEYENSEGQTVKTNLGPDNKYNSRGTKIRYSADSLRKKKFYLYGGMNQYEGIEMTDTDGDKIYTATIKTIPGGYYYFRVNSGSGDWYTENSWGIYDRTQDTTFDTDSIYYYSEVESDITVSIDTNDENYDNWYITYTCKDSSGNTETVSLKRPDNIPENPDNLKDFSYNIEYSSEYNAYVAQINGYSGTDKDVTVPSYINGYPVSLGWNVFKDNTDIESVTIPETVRYIGYDCFGGCTSLKTVDMQGVTSIDSEAFENCASLINVKMQSVKKIGDYAFSGCTSFNPQSLPSKLNSIGSYAFYGCTGMTSITIPDSVAYIYYNAFSGCRSLVSVKVGKGIKEIPSYCFYNCTGLSSVTLSKSVEIIRYEAFGNCDSLTKITIPGNIKTIESDAFYSCNNLTTVVFEEGVEEIGGYAFDGCYNLKEITFPSSVKSVSRGAFNGTAWENSLEDGITYIGNIAYNYKGTVPENTVITFKEGTTSICCSFSGQSGIIGVEIPDTVTYIADYVFSNCVNLKNIKFSSSLEEIGDGAFRNCSSLLSLTIPDSVKTIYDYAFEDCTSLEMVKLPASLKSILGSVFYNCTALKDITIDSKNENYLTKDGLLYGYRYEYGYDDSGEWGYHKTSRYELILCPAGKEGSVTLIDDLEEIGSAFNNCTKVTKINIPSSAYYISGYAFSDCTALTAINVSEDNNIYSSKDGVLYNKDKTSIIVYPKSRAGEYTIPSTITAIGEEAFSNCKSLTGVFVPKTVKSIGNYAFSNCTALEKATLCNGLETIGYEAFRNCSSLKSVVIPNTVKYVGNYAFDGCKSLASVTVREGVETIGYGAFRNTGLKKLTLPSSLKTIRSYAFSECSNLTEVSLGGTESIEYSAFYNCSNLVKVDFGSSLKTIDPYAFYYCTKLNEAVLPNTVESIGYSAFQYCNSLEKVTLNNGLKTIGENAFSNCSNLSKINIPASVKSIGFSAFTNSGLGKITVDKNNKQYFSSDDILYRNPILTEEDNDDDNEYDESEEYSYLSDHYPDNTVLVYCPDKKKGDVVIPEGIEAIYKTAFHNCKEVTMISIPSTVKSLGDSNSYNYNDNMLYGMNNLQAVLIPESVESISDNFAVSDYYYGSRLTIYGAKGSEAENFAGIKGYSFKELSEYVAADKISVYSSSTIGEGTENNIFTVTNPTDVTISTVYITSDNPTVASVQNGILVGLKAGKATITAETTNGKKATRTVTVAAADTVFENTSYLSEEKVVKGGTITLYGRTSLENTEGLTFAYQYKKAEASSWSTKAGYSTKTSVDLKLPETGKYVICIKAKNSDGLVIEKFIEAEAVEPVENTSYVKGNKFYNNGSISIVTSAKQGFGDYRYKFEYMEPNSTEWTVRSYSWDWDYWYEYGYWYDDWYTDYFGYGDNRIITFYPKEAGTYKFRITVRDAKGNLSEKILEVDVAQALVNNAKVNYNRLEIGNSINVTADADGGSGDYTYAYYYKKVYNDWYDNDWDDWSFEKDFSKDKTLTFTPETVGTYLIEVAVCDSEGTVESKSFYVDVNSGLNNVSTLESYKIPYGEEIVIYGKGNGGTGNYTYTYQYKKATDTKWVKINADSTNSYVTVKPSKATDYQVRVTVKDALGKSASKTIDCKVYNPLKNESKLSAEYIAPGSDVTVEASASGGIGEYEYAYYYKKASDTKWVKKSDFTKDTSVVITPAKTADYMIKVIVRDSEGTESESILNLTVNKSVSNTSVLSANEIVLGESVKVNASAQYGAGDYTYAYYYKKTTDKNWLKKSDYTKDTSVEITPSKATEYQIKVVAKDKSGKTSSKTLTLNVNAKLENTSVLSSSTVVLGDSVTVKASATGGKGGYTYTYYYKKVSDTKWLKKADYSENTVVEITPAKASNYQIKVLVKDNSGKVEEKILTLSVNAQLENNSKLSADTVKLGESVTVNASAKGGSGNYTYAYYYKKTTDTKWLKKADYSENSSAEITPAKASDYQIKVLVKDSSGKVEEKILELKVSE